MKPQQIDEVKHFQLQKEIRYQVTSLKTQLFTFDKALHSSITRAKTVRH